MATDLNQVLICGHLSKDCMILGDNKGVSFTVATNYEFTKADGTKVKTTEYTSVTAWGFHVKHAPKLLKGAKVFVQGRLQTDVVDKPPKGKVYYTKVIAENLVVVSPPKDWGDAPKQEYASKPNVVDQMIDDDVPF